MSCTARHDTSHIETLVSPLTNLLVISIPDRMGKLTRQGGDGEASVNLEQVFVPYIKTFLIGSSAFTGLISWHPTKKQVKYR